MYGGCCVQLGRARSAELARWASSRDVTILLQVDSNGEEACIRDQSSRQVQLVVGCGDLALNSVAQATKCTRLGVSNSN